MWLVYITICLCFILFAPCSSWLEVQDSCLLTTSSLSWVGYWHFLLNIPCLMEWRVFLVKGNEWLTELMFYVDECMIYDMVWKPLITVMIMLNWIVSILLVYTYMSLLYFYYHYYYYCHESHLVYFTLCHNDGSSRLFVRSS